MTIQATNLNTNPQTAVAEKIEEDKIISNYIQENKDVLFNFLMSRGVILTHLTQDQYINAKELGAGISGARKLTIDDKTYIVKMQSFTNEFKENLISVFLRSASLNHSLISESDDPFVDFPRKEALGSRIAAALGIEIPQTELITTGGHEIGSLQEYLSPEKAITMSKTQNLLPTDIEFQSAVNTIFFHIITENIDGHSGNILLVRIDKTSAKEDDDDDISDFKSVPIDFGLIFPRHRGIYPQEMNLVKKDFYKLFERKTISTKANLIPLIENAKNLNSPELQKVAKEHEIKLLNTNLLAMQIISQKFRKIKVQDLFDEFVKTATELKEKN